LFVSRTPKNRDVLYAEQDGKLREVTSVSAEQKAQWERFMRDGTLPPPPDTKPQPAPKTAAQVDEEKRQAAEAEAKKPKDTGWNMAGTGYGGKRYIGRNITLDDGRQVVARIYENAGNYEEAEVKVDGVRKFAVTDRNNAQDKADAFIKTLTGKAAESASSDMTPEEAAKYLKDFVYSLNQLDGMTDRAQVFLSSPRGKSGRDNLLMEAFGLNREQAHDINNRIDARQPKKLRNIDMQDAFDVFPSLRKMLYDAIQQAQPKVPKSTRLSAEQRKVLDASLLAGSMSVEDYMKATGLTDDDVGTFQADGLRRKAERQAREASPYHQIINKMQVALTEQMKSAMEAASSTPQQRKSKQERMARVDRDRATLDMLTLKFEHPFDNNYVSKLSPIMKSRFNKQFDGVKTGAVAKAEFADASYRSWAELLIEAANKKQGITTADAAPAQQEAKNPARAVADGFVEQAAQSQQAPAATENVAEAIPIFERYDDAMAWMKDRAKSQGLSVIAYRATDEFKNALSPQLQALYAASKSKWDADTAEAGKAMQAAMAQAGIRPGDTVEWVQSGAFLSQDRMSGVVRLDSNGVPQVHMGSEIAVAKPGGKIGYTKKLRWQDYMKKSGEAGKREQNQPEAPAATEPVAQPITRADVTAAQQHCPPIPAHHGRETHDQQGAQQGRSDGLHEGEPDGRCSRVRRDPSC
jgi:hypothetical protein